MSRRFFPKIPLKVPFKVGLRRCFRRALLHPYKAVFSYSIITKFDFIASTWECFNLPFLVLIMSYTRYISFKWKNLILLKVDFDNHVIIEKNVLLQIIQETFWNLL